MNNHCKFNRIEGKLIEVEDEILAKVDNLESKINSMKDQILRITRLIDQDNNEKESFLKQTDTDINELEEKVVNYFQEEKQLIRKTIDERYLECENKIKCLLDESKDNKEELKNKLILIREQVEVNKN
jgi:wobble nucleotide-excising tRNase